MNKRFFLPSAALVLVLVLLAGCGSSGKSRIVHCDRCGKEISVAEGSNMTDDWIIYCSDCEKELGLDDIVTTE